MKKTIEIQILQLNFIIANLKSHSKFEFQNEFFFWIYRFFKFFFEFFEYKGFLLSHS